MYRSFFALTIIFSILLSFRIFASAALNTNSQASNRCILFIGAAGKGALPRDLKEEVDERDLTEEVLDERRRDEYCLKGIEKDFDLIKNHLCNSINAVVAGYISSGGAGLCTVGQVKSAIENFLSGDGRDFIIYYSGHGCQNGDWALSDGRFSAQDMINLLEKQGRKKAFRRLLIISDACHAGGWYWPLKHYFDSVTFADHSGMAFYGSQLQKETVKDYCFTPMLVGALAKNDPDFFHPNRVTSYLSSDNRPLYVKAAGKAIKDLGIFCGVKLMGPSAFSSMIEDRKKALLEKQQQKINDDLQQQINDNRRKQILEFSSNMSTVYDIDPHTVAMFSPTYRGLKIYDTWDENNQCNIICKKLGYDSCQSYEESRNIIFTEKMVYFGEDGSVNNDDALCYFSKILCNKN
ncbi:MAG: caspase family protein [Oligoflexia bacterium]|nr:caspase family protein [Oligoflexia bacterium]